MFSKIVYSAILAGLAVAPAFGQPPNLADLLEAGENVSPGAPDASRDGDRNRLPVPSKADCARVMSTLREVFGLDAAKAKSQEAKTELATELLRHASEEKDSVAKFVLLNSALGLLTSAGSPQEAFHVIDVLAKSFDLQAADMKLAALEEMAAKGPSDSLGPVIDAVLTQAATQLDSGDAKSSEKLCKLAISTARRARDGDRQRQAVDQLSQTREASKLLEQERSIEEKLKLDPADRDAATELGELRCFKSGRWEEGLPLLAKGSDPALQRLAELELQAESNSTRSVSLGDGWYDYSRSQKGDSGAAALARARMHYGNALEGLSGLARAKVEKRLEQISEEAGNAAPGGPLLDMVRKLGGAAIWLDAANQASVQGSPQGAARLNSEVSSWLDSSRGGKGFAAVSPKGMPTLVSAGSGLRALQFDGVDDCLVAKDWPSGLAFPLTVIIVFKAAPPAPGSNQIRMLLDNAHEGAEAGFCLQLFPRGQVYRLSAGSEVSLQDLSRWQIVAAVFGDRGCATYLGGTLGSSSPNGMTTRIQSCCFLGCWGMAPAGTPRDRFFDGQIGEVIILNKGIAAPEAAAISGILQSKWGK